MGDHKAKHQPAKGAQLTDPDKTLLEAKPDWDRMGEIADRLLSTPPERQTAGKPVSPKATNKKA